MRHIWKGEKRKKAEHLVAALLSAKKANGWTLNFQNELHFRALSALTDTRLQHGVILRILKEMEKKGKTGCDGFEDVQQEEQKRSWSTNCKWSLRMPWYVKAKPEVSLPLQLTVCGTRFKASKWKYYESEIRGSKLLPNLESHCRGERKVFSGLCLSTETTGRTPYEVWDKLAPSTDALRGLVELTFGFGGQQWSMPPRPKCAVPHPLWVVMLPDSGEPKALHFIVDDPGVKEKEIDLKVLQVLRTNARFFGKSPAMGSIDELLLDCLRLYAQAMDERLHSRALLAWWQLAEALTLSVRVNGDTKLVARRLEWLSRRKLKLDLTGIEECLLAVAEHRNDIVHRGDSRRVDETDCNFTKVVCESALLWLANNRKKIPNTSTLEKAYQLSTQSNREVENLRKAIKLV